MKSFWNLALRIVGAALLCLLPQAAGFSQSYTIRPTCVPKAPCKVATETFGFNDTRWRQWPGQARIEERDAGAVGGTVLPTPPAIPEQPLPHAETVAPKPPFPSGAPGESILPPGPSNGKTAPAGPPSSEKPRELIPKTTPGSPEEGIEPTPITPKTEGSGGTGTNLPKEPVSPGGLLPNAGAPKPITPGTEPAKTPAGDSLSPKSFNLEPEVAPSPGTKPEAPSPARPIKDSSLSRQRKDLVAARISEPPMQANWDASLEPETVGGDRFRTTSFEQQSPKSDHPLHSGLGGYCPVQLQENDRWVAGNQDLRLTYQGQVFVFSSDAARKRFEAAPEKYAPVQSGNDVVLAMEENRTVPGSVTHSAIWRGRLYLFSNSATLAAFQDDPARYVKANAAQPTPLQLPADSL